MHKQTKTKKAHLTKSTQKRKIHTSKPRQSKQKSHNTKKATATPVFSRLAPVQPKSILSPLSFFSQHRKFSTEQTSAQQSPDGESAEDFTHEQRAKFKTIVSTMNSDQQLVVQALVSESTMLRQELQNFVRAIEQQEEQLESLTAQLSEVKQNVHDQQELFEEEDLQAPYQHLDASSPTYFEDMINAEHHPRVKASLIREHQLRKEIQPLITIMDAAAQEKVQWKKRSTQLTLTVAALTGLVVSQGIMIYTTGTPQAVVGQNVSGLAGGNEGLNVYLQEAVDIIQQFEQQGKVTKTVGTDVQSSIAGTKYQIFKEKLRLYNLANPKAPIHFDQAIE